MSARNAIEMLVDEGGLPLTVSQWPLPRDAVQRALDTLPAELPLALDAARAQVRAELRAQQSARIGLTLRERKDLDVYWIEVNRLENEADQLYRRLLAKLFDGAFDALTVLKLKEVAEQLEAAADAFENVANAIETIVVKES